MALEFGEEAVAARAFLESLQLLHGQKTHVGASGQAFPIDARRAEPRLDLRQVNANEILFPQDAFRQAL